MKLLCFDDAAKPDMSLSVRRAWIEIKMPLGIVTRLAQVALREESVD